MKNSILKNRLYLYLTEFFAGMSVMAVELGASRLLAPYFSSSQIVWTIIIGTIMIAMALGNLYGGKAADKDISFMDVLSSQHCGSQPYRLSANISLSEYQHC